MLPPLTKKQKEILDYIQNSIKLNGYSPSLEEIKDQFCLKAVSTVHEHIENLKNKGYIKKEMNQARGIQVISKKKMQNYSNIKIKGTISDLEVKIDPNLNEFLVLDSKIIDKECASFALEVKDDSLDKYAIPKNSMVIISESTDHSKAKFLLVQKKNNLTIQKFNNSDLINTKGWIKSIIQIY